VLKVIRYTIKLLLATALQGSKSDLAGRLSALESSIGTSRHASAPPKDSGLPGFLWSWLPNPARPKTCIATPVEALSTVCTLFTNQLVGQSDAWPPSVGAEVLARLRCFPTVSPCSSSPVDCTSLLERQTLCGGASAHRKAYRLGKFLQNLDKLQKTPATSRYWLLEVLANGGEGVYYFVEQFTW
jgi:Peroxisomal biogenesis factor 11 (PEX11)